MHNDRVARAAADMSAIDVLLMRVAIRIQLPPHLYNRACERFDTIQDWLNREASEIAHMVQDFYVQGSFDIGATILQAKDSRADDGFDIDAMLQIEPNEEISSPDDVLDLLFRSIRAEKGSRYYDKARRRARCVTIDYAELHFDVTPTVRRFERTPRTGDVFEAKPDQPRSKDKVILANPFGFGEWFKRQVGASGLFGEVFEGASISYDRSIVESLGLTASDVPDQIEAYRKPLAVIALQLLKRWRYVTYDRIGGSAKLPPSVLLAYFAAKNAGHSTGLLEELRSLALYIFKEISEAIRENRLIVVKNPGCEEDSLTDRWPRDVGDQRVLAQALKKLLQRLTDLEGKSLSEQREILIELFGEAPGSGAVESIIDDRAAANMSAGPLTRPGRATIPVGLGASTTAPSGVRAAPKHRFFGG